MRKKQSGARTERAKMIILSLILAVAAWAAIMWVDDPDITVTLNDLNVRFIGEAELKENGLVITGKSDIPQMSASVSGKRSDLMKYMSGVRIEVDASQITEAGEYTLAGALSLPSSRLTVVKEKYGDVPIRVEKLSEKEIEIRIKQTGTLKNKLVKSEITNPKVVINGAKSEIDAVAYGVATVDISGIDEDGGEPSGYVLMDAGGNLISKNETIETNTLSVEVLHTVYNLKNLPVESELSDELSSQYAISAVTVTPSRVDVGVRDLNSDASVKAVISKISDDGNIEAELAEAEGMYIPEANKTVKIRAEVNKLVTKPVELNIEAQNAPEGKHVSIERVSLAISGEESKLNNDNIKAYVDLSGLRSGTHSVLVKIEGEGIIAPDNCYAIVTID